MVWLRFLGKESWLYAGLFSVGATAAIYVLFAVLLGVPFPDDAVAQIWGG